MLKLADRQNFLKAHTAECIAPLEECAEILNRKGADYGTENFKEAAQIASILSKKDFDAQDVVHCLIGIKMARLANLDYIVEEPKNESVKDTVRDLLNYVVLSRRERARKNARISEEESAEQT